MSLSSRGTSRPTHQYTRAAHQLQRRYFTQIVGIPEILLLCTVTVQYNPWRQCIILLFVVEVVSARSRSESHFEMVVVGHSLPRAVSRLT